MHNGFDIQIRQCSEKSPFREAAKNVLDNNKTVLIKH